MEITLEKIELVRDRTGVTYKEAKDALEAADGNVVDAIISIEEQVDGGEVKSVKEKKDALVTRMKEIVNKGNVSKIVVSKEEKTIVNIPLTVGLLGTVIAPWGIIAGVVAAFGFKCRIQFVKDDGSVVEISDKFEEKASDVREKGQAFYADLKEKSGGTFDKLRDAADDLKAKGLDVFGDLKEKSGGTFDKIKDAADDLKEKIRKGGEDIAEDFQDEVDELKAKVDDKVEDVKEFDLDALKKDIAEDLEELKKDVTEKIGEVSEEACDKAEEACEKAEEACAEACEKAEEVKEEVKDAIE